MSYVLPKDVLSPRRHWQLIFVLYDGGPDNDALAFGRWKGKPTLAMRWNGSAEAPLGCPQSRGLATWFILPVEYAKRVLNTGHFSRIRDGDVELARRALEEEV